MKRLEVGAELAGLLQYLREIGYGDLYLPGAEVGRPAAAGPARRPAAVPPPSPAPQAQSAAAAPASSGTAPVAASPDSPLPAEPADRAAALAALGAQAEVCDRCRLAQGRNRVVFGSGNPDADLMFIGEGPGAEEDRQGLPFVGAAGELLTRIIQAMGMEREQVYIANIVKCRPPGNRDPQPDEVAACRGYLERQIDLVRPRAIVALGRIAAQTLLGSDAPIGRLRGRWYQVRGVPAMVTYHPAALLRNPQLKRPTWDDVQQVRDRVQAAGGS